MLLKQKNPHGGDIYSNSVSLDFSANLNPFGMPEEVRDAICSAAETCSRYPDPYCRQLRHSISAAEGVPEDMILCGNGASELIYCFSQTLSTDRNVLIVSPSFSEYESSLDSAGVPCEHYTLREEDGFELNERILGTSLSSYQAVFLCTPNNPTGTCIKPDLLLKIAETGVTVFCDMCFLDLTDDPGRYDIPSLLKRYPNIIILKAMTKNYSLAGIRLGYAMSSDTDLLEAMSGKVQCWNVSEIAQQAGIAALGCSSWLKASVRSISEERKRVSAELSSMDIRVYPSEANFLLLRSDKELFGELLSRGILIRDCSNYRGLGDGFYRIAVRIAQENDILLKNLREVTK